MFFCRIFCSFWQTTGPHQSEDRTLKQMVSRVSAGCGEPQQKSTSLRRHLAEMSAGANSTDSPLSLWILCKADFTEVSAVNIYMPGLAAHWSPDGEHSDKIWKREKDKKPCGDCVTLWALQAESAVGLLCFLVCWKQATTWPRAAAQCCVVPDDAVLTLHHCTPTHRGERESLKHHQHFSHLIILCLTIRLFKEN